MDAEGNRLNDGVTLPTIMEVTPEFYDSETWEIVRNWAQALYTRWQSYPVLAVESLDLLPSFHENTVFLSAGREITDAGSQTARLCAWSARVCAQRRACGRRPRAALAVPCEQGREPAVGIQLSGAVARRPKPRAVKRGGRAVFGLLRAGV